MAINSATGAGDQRPSALNDSCSSLAIIQSSANSDEIKIWDVSANTVDSVVALEVSKVTSLSFVAVSMEKEKGRKSAKRTLQQKEFIVLGMQNGFISVFDPAASSFTTAAVSAHKSSVVSICAASGSRFITAGQTEVKVWELLPNGSCSVITSISHDSVITSCAASGEFLAIGASQIALMNLGDGALLKTFSGHPSGPVSALKFTPEASYLTSTSEKDRNIFMWQVAGVRTEAVASAPFPDIPHSLTVSDSLAAAICNGMVYIAECKIMEAKKRTITLKPSAQISFSSDHIVHVELDGSRLLTTRGSFSVPVFEFLQLYSTEGTLISGQLERSPVKKSLKSGGASKGKKSIRKNVEVVDASSAPLMSVPENQAKQDHTDDHISEESGNGLQSISTLLVQAVRSKNPELIESALNVCEESIILKSIQKLPQSCAMPLLECLITRVVKSPARSPQLAPWIRCLHLVHGTHLSSLATYASVMKPLQDTITTSTSSFKQLLQLQAKIELMLAQRTLEAASLGSDDHLPQPSADYIEYVDVEDDLMDEVVLGQEEEPDSMSESDAENAYEDSGVEIESEQESGSSMSD